jgi:hypothetical protein
VQCPRGSRESFSRPDGLAMSYEALPLLWLWPLVVDGSVVVASPFSCLRWAAAAG